MNILNKIYIFLLFVALIFYSCSAPVKQKKISIEDKYENSKPWVIWYWMYSAVSKDGISADIEAMSKAGIGGAYLMTIFGPKDNPYIEPVAEQLSPYWWELIKYAFSEAKRFNIKIALHISDGFALAGGPWITPELSMQKIVFSEQFIKGPIIFNDSLTQPEIIENYYKDIGIFAIPVDSSYTLSTRIVKPEVFTSNNSDASFLIDYQNDKVFRCADSCWIEYRFKNHFTCRSITIFNKTNTNYQSLRLIVQISNDGINYNTILRLTPPRHGWQDEGIPSTFNIPEVSAKYFRFLFDPSNSECGSEVLDAAKWRPSLKLTGIELSGMPRINQFEGKSARVWRLSSRGYYNNDSLCINPENILNISKYFNNNVLKWNVPEGFWLILRIGHTSTGHTNATGGAAKGLECDKFNKYAVNLHLSKWFGTIRDTLSKYNLEKQVKYMHVDSWECGSQNWSECFSNEFKKRRGYDLINYLPVMAGIPIKSFEFSESILYDVRKTVSELVVDNFYGTLKEFAHNNNCLLTAESTAPVITSDNLYFFKNVDLPMGEFWLNSPTHDKPNDIFDAISGGHLYGKNIIQAEAFTQLRIQWNEYPGYLKKLGDLHYALGINKFIFHVFTHNPWIDKKPGMTLNGVGIYFQRDQIWWPHISEYINYITRCQNLLQKGKPVIDVLVYSGSEIPVRSILPYQLIDLLPGLYNKKILEREFVVKNIKNIPIVEFPEGVKHTDFIPQASDWINPWRFYKYDCFNDNMLLSADVSDGKIIINNMEYDLIIIPDDRRQNISASYVSVKYLLTLKRLLEKGAKVLVFVDKFMPAGLNDLKQMNVYNYFNYILKSKNNDLTKISIKHGTLYIANKYLYEDLNVFNISPDVIVNAENENYSDSIDWNHRNFENTDIYFLTNQSNSKIDCMISFRVNNKYAVIYDPMDDNYYYPLNVELKNERTNIRLSFEKNSSVFVLFYPDKTLIPSNINNFPEKFIVVDTIKGLWNIKFNDPFGAKQLTLTTDKLFDWTSSDNKFIKYFSGIANYEIDYNFKFEDNKNLFLSFDNINNTASVYINNVFCGTIWTEPYRINITKKLNKGSNNIKIEVANTWINCLCGNLYENIYTNAPARWENKKPLKSGITGNVLILTAE